MSYLASFQPNTLLETWQAVLIASAQKLSEILYSESIDLAISIKVLFFLSTRPFCSGVYLVENSYLIPFSSYYSSTLVFLNSLPLSLLTFFTLSSNSFSALVMNFLNMSYVSALSWRKKTHLSWIIIYYYKTIAITSNASICCSTK